MDIKEVFKSKADTKVEGTYIIENIKLVPFKEKSKGDFLVFKLFDKSGIIDAKIWNDADKIIKTIREGDVVNIIGSCNLYNDKISIIVGTIKVDDDYDISKLLPASEHDPKLMYKELCEILDGIKDPDILKLWKEIQNDEHFMDKFLVYPAGKGKTHHAYRFGLLEHTLNIIKIVRNFAKSIKVDENKMYIGGLLHDAGKVFAYKYDTKIDMTNIGRLHEHTAIGYSYFMIKMSDIDIEVEKRLKIIEEVGHIILSHHDIPEYHAIVKPMTIEAKMVAQADFLDAFGNRYDQTFKDCEDDWFYSQLDKQFFFRRK